MLLNLSNHPSSNWGEKQMQAAQAYGNVKDITFPQVDPYASENEIKQLALNYFTQIKIELNQCNDRENAVHIMGELSFCHALVSLLQRSKITCLVSTTKRNSKETNGEKISKFQFVKFRTYV
jgi:hypothetical protein